MCSNYNSRYIPKSSLKATLSAVKKSVSYRIWKRKITKFSNYSKFSKFSYLDVGFGAGALINCMYRWYPNATLYGLDVEPEHLDYVKKRIPSATILQYDGYELPFSDNSIDVLSVIQVVEHMADPVIFLNETKRILSPKGILILTTPNLDSLAAKILKSNWQGYSDVHLFLKTSKQWKDILENNGFDILEDGTTLFTGFKIFQLFPLCLINWLPMIFWGYFHWSFGESYVSISKVNHQKKID